MWIQARITKEMVERTLAVLTEGLPLVETLARVVLQGQGEYNGVVLSQGICVHRQGNSPYRDRVKTPYPRDHPSRDVIGGLTPKIVQRFMLLMLLMILMPLLLLMAPKEIRPANQCTLEACTPEVRQETEGPTRELARMARRPIQTTKKGEDQ